MSAPKIVNSFATASIRLVSLTFNSSASRMIVVPVAWVANKAIIGNSSIKRGIIAPPISVAVNWLVFTSKSPEWLASSSFKIVTEPPMFLITSKIPVRVWFKPTFFRSISLSGTTKPATKKKAAEEISPGTTTFWPVNCCGPVNIIFLPSTSSVPPNCRIISSVWSRVFSFSTTTEVPSACKAANKIADFTWALATGIV